MNAKDMARHVLNSCHGRYMSIVEISVEMCCAQTTASREMQRLRECGVVVDPRITRFGEVIYLVKDAAALWNVIHRNRFCRISAALEELRKGAL